MVGVQPSWYPVGTKPMLWCWQHLDSNPACHHLSRLRGSTLLSFSDPKFNHLRNAISGNILRGTTGGLILSTPDFKRKKTLESLAKEKGNISPPLVSPLPSPLVAFFLQKCPLEGTQAPPFPASLPIALLLHFAHVHTFPPRPGALVQRSARSLRPTRLRNLSPAPSTAVPGNASFLRRRYSSPGRWSFASLGR